MFKTKREYTKDLLANIDNPIEAPCQDCNQQYKCYWDSLACTQFRFFVETGRMPCDSQRNPTRKIYVELFHNEPQFRRVKEREPFFKQKGGQ